MQIKLEITKHSFNLLYNIEKHLITNHYFVTSHL